MIGNMTVRAQLHVDVCKTSHGCEGDEQRRVILCYDGDVLDWGGGDWIHPSIRPGKGVFAHGGHSSFAPRACVSMVEFTTLRLWSCMYVLGDWGECQIVLIG